MAVIEFAIYLKSDAERNRLDQAYKRIYIPGKMRLHDYGHRFHWAELFAAPDIASSVRSALRHEHLEFDENHLTQEVF